MNKGKLVYKQKNFEVYKGSDDFYGLYEKYCDVLKTHKTTKSSAIKLCNLLQYAYDLAMEEISYNEQMNSYR